MRISESVSLCEQVIKEIRTLSYLLHPPLLDEVGLASALQWYVRGFNQRSGIQVEVTVVPDVGRLRPSRNGFVQGSPGSLTTFVATPAAPAPAFD